MTEDLHDFATRARSWLESGFERAQKADAADIDDDIAVFHSLKHDEEAALIKAAAAWQAVKYDAGFAGISWSTEYGGAGLTEGHERRFAELEQEFHTPSDHELRRITTNLVAPTVLAWGTLEQKAQFIRMFLRCDELVCQLFSEPSAGSDLANVGTRATHTDDGWLVDGAKVWVSGAQFADWGLLLARTDPHLNKYEGMTAFLLPMTAPGVEVRPIRQMTGGSSFNEVFFDSVTLPDDLRLGERGEGWKVALTVLGFERGQSGSKAGVGGSWDQLVALARRSPRRHDPVVRQLLVSTFMHERVRALTRLRATQAFDRTGTPGPEGSLGKLLWVQGMTMIGEAAGALVGPGMAADMGTPGTYTWSQQILGAPGFHVAGGSDEVQRNIVGERLLRLPPEPRVDRSPSWRDLQRTHQG